jgi:hypothetical protein
MSLETFIQAMESLQEWPGLVGIIGGEPLIHPHFEEICRILSKYFSKERTGLWTSGGPSFEKRKPLITNTFNFLAYNEHNPMQLETCKHQPLTMAIKDVVPDQEMRRKLIDDCWVQRTWCPTIGNKGAFFCEVAYAIDTLIDGPGGYPIEPGWWKKTPDQFQDQVDRYCDLCGMAIPYKRELIKNKVEKVSPTILNMFRSLNLPNMEDDKVELINDQLTNDQIKENAQTWYPGNYRGDRQDDYNSLEGRGSTFL